MVFGTYYNLTFHLLVCHIHFLCDIHCMRYTFLLALQFAIPISVILIQNCQETSVDNLFMQSCTCCCFYGQRKQYLVLCRGPSCEDMIKSYSVLTAALQSEQVTAQGLPSVSFPTLLPTDLPHVQNYLEKTSSICRVFKLA